MVPYIVHTRTQYAHATHDTDRHVFACMCKCRCAEACTDRDARRWHMHVRIQTGAQRHADTHTCAPRHPDPALLKPWPLLPQDQHKDVQPLQVEYYPPNGTFSLHYFPYYGKKAQVGASLFACNSYRIISNLAMIGKRKAVSILPIKTK